ncbi:signal peptidase II [Eggerthella guodeyinii]|uniref:signal peptidase II n=1 Tax=Eggerthella guodeyinii TaxID=2690837 RepID=UPI001F2A1158|nr:signal peptidase II [Eggerthella guodeyinii]
MDTKRSRNTLVFGIVALAWLALDTLTKSYFNGSYAVGEVVTGPLLGLVRFHLVHNTGAAWGMFGDSTFLLGVMSLIVCVLLTVYLFFLAHRPSTLQVVGVALVVAGGLGNAFDRFTLGYVVDFIEPVFIDFPVFNVADIGVTCGFVLFLVGVILSWRHEDRIAAASAEASEASSEAPDDARDEGTDAR